MLVDGSPSALVGRVPIRRLAVEREGRVILRDADRVVARLEDRLRLGAELRAAAVWRNV
jgi:hypothetical protein